MLEELEIPLFEIKVQKAIGNELKLINEMLITNNKIINALEQLAQTLFKRWFVDFEFPNENSEPYKSSGGVMVESDLGMVPERWSVGTASELFEFSPKTILKKGETVDYVEIKDLNSSAVINTWKRRTFTGSGSKFMNGDTLLARITPYFENGEIQYVYFMEEGDVGSGFTEVITIRSKPEYSKTLTYFLLQIQSSRITLQII